MASPLESSRIDALDRLKQLLAHSPGAFSMNLAVCPDPRLRDAIIAQVRGERAPIAVAVLSEGTNDVFAEVQRQAGDGPHEAIFVVGLDSVLESPRDLEIVFAALNACPRRWKAWYACPAVFWVSPDTSRSLGRDAKDFWEWTTGWFNFASAP
ncbi:MAG: hypothetical protein AAB353_04230 [Candidatus Hydrogenedentota bacterium]